MAAIDAGQRPRDVLAAPRRADRRQRRRAGGAQRATTSDRRDAAGDSRSARRAAGDPGRRRVAPATRTSGEAPPPREARRASRAFAPTSSPLIKGFDLFVMSSETEGLGTSLLDAMAAGKACIGTRVGGIPEVIDDGAPGLSCRRTTLSTGRRHRAAVEGRDLRSRMGEAGLARVKAQFSVERMVEGTLAAYRTLARPLTCLDRGGRAVRRCGRLLTAVEHPASTSCGPNGPAGVCPQLQRGTVMQVPLAVIGCLAGLGAGW